MNQNEAVKQEVLVVRDPAFVEKAIAYVHELNRAIRVVNGQDPGPVLENMKELEPAKYAGVKKAVEKILYGESYPSPSMQHDEWIFSKLKDGWTYGPSEDKIAKTHPCMVQFYDLPLEEKLKDVVFVEVLKFLRAVMQVKAGETIPEMM